MIEARMLPLDGPLTAEQRADVIRRLDAYKAEHGLSDKDVGRQVVLSAQTINELRRGRYGASTETVDDHLREINDWLERDARRRATKSATKFVTTEVAKRILVAADQASRTGTMWLCHGPTGIGKTMCAHAVVERFPGAIYMRVNVDRIGYEQIRGALVEALRLKNRPRVGSRGFGTLHDRIFSALRDSNRLMVIDEAHRLSHKALEYLRDIHDECKLPVLLLATKDLMEEIVRDSDRDHGQLFSRITCLDLTAATGSGSDSGGEQKLFSVTEIRRLYETTGHVRLAADAAKYLQDVANDLGKGSLRACDRLMHVAIPIARKLDKVAADQSVLITAELLQEVEMECNPDPALRAELRSRAAPRPPVAASA